MSLLNSVVCDILASNGFLYSIHKGGKSKIIRVFYDHQNNLIEIMNISLGGHGDKLYIHGPSGHGISIDINMIDKFDAGIKNLKRQIEIYANSLHILKTTSPQVMHWQTDLGLEKISCNNISIYTTFYISRRYAQSNCTKWTLPIASTYFMKMNSVNYPKARINRKRERIYQMYSIIAHNKIVSEYGRFRTKLSVQKGNRKRRLERDAINATAANLTGMIFASNETSDAPYHLCNIKNTKDLFDAAREIIRKPSLMDKWFDTHVTYNIENIQESMIELGHSKKLENSVLFKTA